MDKKQTNKLLKQSINKANALLERIRHYLPQSESNDDVRAIEQDLYDFIEELENFWIDNEYERAAILRRLETTLNDFESGVERLYNEDTEDEEKDSNDDDDEDEDEEEEEDEDEGKQEDLDNLREEKDDEEPPRQRQRTGTGRKKKGGAVSAKALKELVSASYSKNPEENIDGFVLDKSLSNETAKVYYNPHTGQATIVHRGTSGANDWLNNAAYATGLYNTTNRYKQGEATQKAVEDKYGAKNVSTIGHSQGAVLARKLGKNSKEIINLNPAYMGEQQGENEYNVNSSTDVVSSLLKPKETFNKYFYPSTYRKNKEKNITIESKNPADVLTEHSSKILNRLDPNQMIGQGRELGFKRYKLKPHEELTHWRGGGPCFSRNQVRGERYLPNGMRLEPGEILIRDPNDSSSSDGDTDEDYEDLNFESSSSDEEPVKRQGSGSASTILQYQPPEIPEATIDEILDGIEEHPNNAITFDEYTIIFSQLERFIDNPQRLIPLYSRVIPLLQLPQNVADARDLLNQMMQRINPNGVPDPEYSHFIPLYRRLLNSIQ
jgi:hypothetical protein